MWQGDCTIVLVDALGEKGDVDAVDLGSLGYGQSLSFRWDPKP